MNKHWNDIAKHFLGDDFFSSFKEDEKDRPFTDVYHTDKEVIVLIELPGVENIQELEMQVREDKLIIRGYLPELYSQYRCKLNERKPGPFEKTIELGTTVSNKHTGAQYRKGILEVRFPITKSTVSKRIHLNKKR